MVVENISSASFEELISQVSFLSTVLQAIGGIIVLYIIFNVVNIIITRKRNKKLDKMNENIEEIKKLLEKGKKKK